jgi:hypothetical protein
MRITTRASARTRRARRTSTCPLGLISMAERPSRGTKATDPLTPARPMRGPKRTTIACLGTKRPAARRPARGARGQMDFARSAPPTTHVAREAFAARTARASGKCAPPARARRPAATVVTSNSGSVRTSPRAARRAARTVVSTARAPTRASERAAPRACIHASRRPTACPRSATVASRLAPRAGRVRSRARGRVSCIVHRWDSAT